jgi:hypothetical protein
MVAAEIDSITAAIIILLRLVSFISFLFFGFVSVFDHFRLFGLRREFWPGGFLRRLRGFHASCVKFSRAWMMSAPLCVLSSKIRGVTTHAPGLALACQGRNAFGTPDAGVLPALSFLQNASFDLDSCEARRLVLFGFVHMMQAVACIRGLFYAYRSASTSIFLGFFGSFLRGRPGELAIFFPRLPGFSIVRMVASQDCPLPRYYHATTMLLP